MAWNHDRDPVCTVGMADGALAGFRSNAVREFFIRTGRAIGNLQQFIPDANLKRRTRIYQRQRKLPQLARKVGIEFLSELSEVFVVARNDGARKDFLERLELRLESRPVGEF